MVTCLRSRRRLLANTRCAGFVAIGVFIEFVQLCACVQVEERYIERKFNDRLVKYGSAAAKDGASTGSAAVQRVRLQTRSVSNEAPEG